MFKKTIFLLYFFVPCSVFASSDCSKFKFYPEININNINNDVINIKKSENNLNNKLGYVESSITYNTKYMIIPIMVKDGYCLSLRSVDVNINFPEFNIVIDKNLKENTCAYNVVLKHEKDHIQSEKNVINNNIENIKNAVLNAALTIEPVFVKHGDNTEKYKEKMFTILKEHNDIVNVIDKIKTELKDENEKIDFRGDSWEIWQCKDFFEEMKNSYDKISID